jgi:DNA-binding MarR family transcriptional regulator
MPKDPRDADDVTSRIPMTRLWDVSLDAFFEEFRGELEGTEFDDIRPTHGCVFGFVRDEGMRLTRLATLAGMTKQSVGEVVDDLVKLGYAERIPDPNDKRAKLICLTDRGRSAQSVGFEIFGRLERRWMDRYGEEPWAAMRSFLEQVVSDKAPDLVPELAFAEQAPAPA